MMVAPVVGASADSAKARGPEAAARPPVAHSLGEVRVKGSVDGVSGSRMGLGLRDGGEKLG